ncbi:ribosomal maturation YjgA family protein [Chryseobacterium defluvii]|uniref:Uncharacterized protein DUF2809 n=1 Tax=Chryseobacterium defluvii TaxID=160396 RepID=A0A495S9D7_9FLAO|nr:DUF2809 domain-containing protein [Chryseobacterium defluvii]RKS96503.1 uncharacterized protein DUF2809 [Chryseobacterium defluvii]
MKLKFNTGYFLLTIFLFLIEVFIAVKLEDIFFVRAYLGDVIVVILLFTFVRSLMKINNQTFILGIFAFSCLVEFAQYFKIAEKIGFPEGSLMYIVIGNSFSWVDILCYAAGCALLYLLVKIKDSRQEKVSLD